MLVVDLDAEDADEGINNELVYFFVEGSQDMGPFHIDRDNGTLYLSGELDYESPSKEYRVSYHLLHRLLVREIQILNYHFQNDCSS